ncbi:P-type ATPase, cytoplasmic domain N [Pseudocohnilembus persalinus]|uniref:Phospholipid-transporting ATPase n=1 Tax=Pseudocohnilembus persalinus TaxID=266149 RepID=A0A0V0QY26_PSEPJ|nr:P-type ATPase, cytoplasmic domain N [Pseudocohnilembus persalinus]|eukprot:KRX07251.1 P-type ATPase, cytoplasmic domain N [Pseudocohnilembus persalinus]
MDKIKTQNNYLPDNTKFLEQSQDNEIQKNIYQQHNYPLLIQDTPNLCQKSSFELEPSFLQVTSDKENEDETYTDLKLQQVTYQQKQQQQIDYNNHQKQIVSQQQNNSEQEINLNEFEQQHNQQNQSILNNNQINNNPVKQINQQKFLNISQNYQQQQLQNCLQNNQNFNENQDLDKQNIFQENYIENYQIGKQSSFFGIKDQQIQDIQQDFSQFPLNIENNQSVQLALKGNNLFDNYDIDSIYQDNCIQLQNSPCLKMSYTQQILDYKQQDYKPLSQIQENQQILDENSKNLPDDVTKCIQNQEDSSLDSCCNISNLKEQLLNCSYLEQSPYSQNLSLTKQIKKAKSSSSSQSFSQTQTQNQSSSQNNNNKKKQKKHTKQKKAVIMFSCKFPKCKYESKSQYFLRLHEKQCHRYLGIDGDYYCEKCQQQFHLDISFKRHMEINHPTQEKIKQQQQNQMKENSYNQFLETKEEIELSGMSHDLEEKIDNQPLLNQGTKKSGGGILCFSSAAIGVGRNIQLNGQVIPKINLKNVVRNQKYNLISFIPLVLFNQFKFFFNFFYLAICLSQFVPALKVGFLFTYASPLVFVLILTMVKEAYDDYKRMKRDQEANSTKYKTFRHGSPITLKSSDLKVGDLVVVEANQRIPADLVIIAADDPHGTVFIRTDQLDGETDWKVRRAIRTTQQQIDFSNLANTVSRLTGEIQAPAINENIYEFYGLFKSSKEDEPLNLEHTLWANTVLATRSVLAAVVYTGKETRMAVNSKHPQSKNGKFDEEVNDFSKKLFLLMVLMSFIMVLLAGFSQHWLVQFFRYLLLLSSIIPISLRVNLDFAKAIFSYKIQQDESMPGTVARNSNIPEELGRVQFLLTDKTGTLTQNEMVFKKLVINEQLYTEDEVDQIKKTVDKMASKHNGPLGDQDKDQPEQKITRRKDHFIVRDFITALGLCHNVTPVVNDDGEKILQASSPDEFALVSFVESLNYQLYQRDDHKIILKNPSQGLENYQILNCFPFSSETKRMGILVRHLESNRLIFYLKGADSIMVNKVKNVYKSTINDECDNLAREGLRTLVITQKPISEQFYQQWLKNYKKAQLSMQNRQKHTLEVQEMLEKDMDLLGITGVEDKLQEDVAHTIESLRNAGIKIWMLTGDKVETAKCIAISTGIRSHNQNLFEMKDNQNDGFDDDDDDDLTEIEDQENNQQQIDQNQNYQFIYRDQLQQFSHKNDTVLLIDGNTLTKVLEHNEELFFKTAAQAPAVICCRCAPKQKSMITEKIIQYTKNRVCCVGDGGNDVGMIQCSNIGIGIKGKEGMQAALASDFSIEQFKFLKTLLLWHGRNSYKRSSTLTHFIVHRGLIISVIQMIFICTFYFVAIPVYNGWLMLGYATVYTCLPVFCLIFDQDIEKNKLAYQRLYPTDEQKLQHKDKKLLDCVGFFVIVLIICALFYGFMSV